MEITSSGVSVYEVVLDLKHWDGKLSNEVPGFSQALIALMPSTAQHKCMSGQAGGFHIELNKGTNFGHVVEHVLLELIRLADPTQPEFSGWTKPLGDGKYMIHYGAPDFLTGRLAAVLAVEIVGELQHGAPVDLQFYVDQLRQPMDSLINGGNRPLELQDGIDSDPVIDAREPPPVLSDWQRDNLTRMLVSVQPRFPVIHARWAKAFRVFGGDFAAGIQDKIELINPDQSLDCLVSGNFEDYFNAVAKFCQMMRTMRIPLNFVSQGAWLYKNFLQVEVLKQIHDETPAEVAIIHDFDDFYQNIFHRILTGFAQPREPVLGKDEVTLCGFRARHVRQGAVLVVDDDVMARKMARSLLEFHGIATEGARHGLEALNFLAENESDIDLVLLDMVMPGLQGEVVCRRIRDSHPKTKIILCSGFPLSQEQQGCLEDHHVGFIAKPYRATELVAMVRELMDFEVVGKK